MPVIRPDASQLVTCTQQLTEAVWLGHVGHVAGLKYSYSCPGGPNTMSATLQIEADRRVPAMETGRIVRIIRGGGIIWEGIMIEPVPTDAGWTLSANGAGNYGTDYVALYTSTWPANQPDESVNNAIGRGMRWVNPGIGSTGMYLGNVVDSGAQDITSLLNTATGLGAYTWYVTTTDYGNMLSVFPLPTVPDRLLVANTPVPRTIGADINTVYERYEVSADNPATGTAQVNATTSSQNLTSAAKYGTRETYVDLTPAGVMTAATAQGYGNNVLQRYIHATYSGPFTVGPGQLLTMGGQPVDLGADQAGHVAQLVLTDYAYGGEVSIHNPVAFLIGGYEYDDDSQTASITPFLYQAADLAGMLSAASGFASFANSGTA